MKNLLTTPDQPILIKKLINGGQGITEKTPTLSKPGFFWNVLPGEFVTEFQITKNKSSYFDAIATKISNPSPRRIKEKDSHFLSTSPWQILDYSYELSSKHQILSELFHPLNLDVPIDPVFTDQKDFYYRNKMEYSLYFNHADQKIHPAIHRRGTHQKIPITSSSIEFPEIFKAAKEIIDDLNIKGEEARKYQSILLRSDQTGAISGGLLENHKPHPHFSNLKDKILGINYSYSPNGFFQINLPVYEAALKLIRSQITTDKVLDLYAGVGTIGLSVANHLDLTLVEINASAHQEMIKNCTQFNSEKIKPILSKSEEALNFITYDATIIVDPPRAGCESVLLEKILEVNPPTIIYLSCNPATQKRDLEILVEKYQITKISPFNFFPRTPHLENLVILKSRSK